MKNSNKVQQCTLYVDGMHCAACEILIEDKISQIDGVKSVNANLARGAVVVETSEELNLESINSLISQHGYSIKSKDSDDKSLNISNILKAAFIAVVLFSAFIFIQQINLTGIIETSELNLSFYFLLGVIASVSTCMAVVGGIVLSISSNYSKSSKYLAIVSFHISRIIAFFILGGLLGVLGGVFLLDSNPLFRLVINVILFVVMIILGINLLNIFKFTKRFQLRLPKVFAKRITSQENSKRSDLFASILLGIFTFILPCGFTQSVQFQALATGNFLDAGMILLAFSLGTLPVLGGISLLSYKLSKNFQSDLFYKTSGFIVILFAFYTFLSFLRTV